MITFADGDDDAGTGDDVVWLAAATIDDTAATAPPAVSIIFFTESAPDLF